jgi:hypothetical protein
MNPSIKGADSSTVEDNLIRANAANGVRVAPIWRSTLRGVPGPGRLIENQCASFGHQQEGRR